MEFKIIFPILDAFKFNYLLIRKLCLALTYMDINVFSGMRIITQNILNLFILKLKLNDLSVLSMKEILINLHSY